jgi:ABC-type branched-subunit amino acid transport system ATPase component
MGDLFFPVLQADQRIDKLPPHHIVRLGIGHCPEGRHIFGRLTVTENLRLGAATRTDRAEIEQARSVVDLPAPLEPIRVTSSPAFTVSDTPLSACILP